MERNISIDILKGVAIILVVFGHLIQFLDPMYMDNFMMRIIYSFHMPLFFSLSGYTLNISKIIEPKNLVFRCLSLLVPFLFWAVYASFDKMDFVICNFWNILVNPDSGYWFLLILAQLLLYSSILFRIFKGKRSEFYLLFSLLFSSVLMVSFKVFDIQTFGLHFFAYQLPYFMLGLYIRRKSVNSHCSLTYISVVSVLLFVILISVLLQFDYNPLVPSDFYNFYIGYFFKIVLAYLAVIGLLGISYQFKNAKLLIGIGQNTIYIYILHYFFIDQLAKTSIFNTFCDNVFYFICSLFIVVIIYLFVSFVKKISNVKYLNYLMFGRIN